LIGLVDKPPQKHLSARGTKPLSYERRKTLQDTLIKLRRIDHHASAVIVVLPALAGRMTVGVVVPSVYSEILISEGCRKCVDFVPGRKSVTKIFSNPCELSIDAPPFSSAIPPKVSLFCSSRFARIPTIFDKILHVTKYET
jgi:hypothetical protein